MIIPTRKWPWGVIALGVLVVGLGISALFGSHRSEPGPDRMLDAIAAAQDDYRLRDYFALSRRFLARFPEHPSASAVRSGLALQLVATNLQTPTSTGAEEARALLADQERLAHLETDRFDAALLLLKFSKSRDPVELTAAADRVRSKYGSNPGVGEVDAWLIARLLELDDVARAARRAEAIVDRAPAEAQADYRRLIARAKLLGQPLGLTDVERARIPRSLEGQVVLLDFWASWCRPCLEAQPALVAFGRAHPEVVIVGVNLDEDDDAMAAHPSPFPQLRGTGLEDRFGITQLPTYLLIDRQGKIAATELEGEALFERAEALLKESNSPGR